jgi:hypothetical protein
MTPPPAPQARNLRTDQFATLWAQLDAIEEKLDAIQRMVAVMCEELGVSPEVAYNEGQPNSRPGDAVNVPGPDTGKE